MRQFTKVSLEIVFEPRAGLLCTVVWVAGSYDAANAGELEAALGGVARAGDVVVDMSRVSFADASVLRVLDRASRTLGAEGRRFGVRGPSRNVERLLEICGMTAWVTDADELEHCCA